MQRNIATSRWAALAVGALWLFTGCGQHAESTPDTQQAINKEALERPPKPVSQETINKNGGVAAMHADRAQLYGEGQDVMNLAKEALTMYEGDASQCSNIVHLASKAVGLEYAPYGPEGHKPVLAAKAQLEELIRAKRGLPQ